MLIIAIHPIAKKNMKPRIITEVIKKLMKASPVVKSGSIHLQPNVHIAARAPHQIKILM